jgi:hypothetical protein
MRKSSWSMRDKKALLADELVYLQQLVSASEGPRGANRTPGQYGAYVVLGPHLNMHNRNKRKLYSSPY